MANGCRINIGQCKKGLSKKDVCVCMCVFLMHVVGEDYKVYMCEFVCMIGGGGVITKYSREQIYMHTYLVS